MTNRHMTGEEMLDVLKAAGWRESERMHARPHDSDDYLIVLMRLNTAERREACYVRLRSEWTSDGTADWLQGLNNADWRCVPDDLKWPAEVADVMRFCS